jgi:crossover junction endodeoxyribonuclease RuvC
MRVLGLDVSTKMGWVLMEDEQVLGQGQIEFKKASGMDRIFKFSDWLDNILTSFQPELVMIEGYAHVFTGSFIVSVEIGTAIRMTCHAHNIKWEEVSPTSLKKFVTGKGKAQKDEMMLGVYKRWGFDPETNNIADAYGLARVGLAYLGLGGPVTEFQKEVLTTIGA